MKLQKKIHFVAIEMKIRMQKTPLISKLSDNYSFKYFPRTFAFD